MATITREIRIQAPPERVWAALRDVGQVHTRLAPGFVTDTRLEGDVRIVTFANGVVARERIVTVDDAARRIAYAVVGGEAEHHNASFQVFADGKATLLVWTTDVLPNAAAVAFEPMIDQGARVIQTTLGGAASPAKGRAQANGGARSRSAS